MARVSAALKRADYAFTVVTFGLLDRYCHTADVTGWLVACANCRALLERDEAPVFPRDAAYANPAMYEFVEAEGYNYKIQLPASAVLQERIGRLLKRPVGRPPHDSRR